MSWEISHRESEEHELCAEELRRQGEPERARESFRKAAEAEQLALRDVNPQAQPETFALTAVNACSLWFEAGEFASARALAQKVLEVPALDPYVPTELHALLEEMDVRERGGSRAKRTREVSRASRASQVPPVSHGSHGSHGSQAARVTWVSRLPLKLWNSRAAWRYWLAAAALIAIGCLASWQYLESRPAAYVTAAGETRAVTLDDGSQVSLHTKTHLEWVDGKSARIVTLASGGALFRVTHDAARPFRVKLDRSEIEVLGTQFDVDIKPNGDIALAVIEGRVAARGYASDAEEPAWEETLKAGDQIVYNGGKILSRKQDVGIQANPNSDRYFFHDKTLAEIVDELNRHTDRRIILRDPALAQRRVSGVLSSNDLARALTSLERGADVKVTRQGNVYFIDAE